MNYLETAKVEIAKFPDKGLYTKRPAEVELRFIEVLASIAQAEETRLLRMATQDNSRSIQNMVYTLARVLKIPSIEVSRLDYRYNVRPIPWVEIENLVSRMAEKYVGENWKEREDNLWATVKRWWKRTDEENENE